jgi:hypothetical protein
MNENLEKTADYWHGRLSMAVAVSLSRPDPRARTALEDFLRADVATPMLVQVLREEMEKNGRARTR